MFDKHNRIALASLLALFLIGLGLSSAARQAIAQDDDRPPSVLDYGNMADLADRVVVSIAIHHAATTPNDYGTSIRSWWTGARQFFLVNGQDMPPAVGVAALAYLADQPGQGRDRARDVPRDVEEFLSVIAIGDWEQIGLPNSLLGGEPTPQLRLAFLSLLSNYAQSTIAADMETLTSLPTAPVVPDITAHSTEGGS